MDVINCAKFIVIGYGVWFLWRVEVWPFPLNCDVAVNTGRTAARLWYSHMSYVSKEVYTIIRDNVEIARLPLVTMTPPRRHESVAMATHHLSSLGYDVANWGPLEECSRLSFLWCRCLLSGESSPRGKSTDAYTNVHRPTFYRRWFLSGEIVMIIRDHQRCNDDQQTSWSLITLWSR